MRRPAAIAASAAAILSLAACATTQAPVEVTRFVDPAAATRLAQGTVFIESAPGAAEGLEAAPYKAAVAAELVRLGYRETNRAEAQQIAQVSVERMTQTPERRRNPVSVGVGGSTGSYGSGLGVGIGINLGGGPRPVTDTRLAVTLRPADGPADSPADRGPNLWEGRADLSVTDNSPLADRTRSAQALAKALFREFPGKSGETVQVEAE